MAHVMLLHGFGAPADDLVPLAEVLDVRAVEFHPFRGGHEIPPEVLQALDAFLAQLIS